MIGAKIERLRDPHAMQRLLTLAGEGVQGIAISLVEEGRRGLR